MGSTEVTLRLLGCRRQFVSVALSPVDEGRAKDLRLSEYDTNLNRCLPLCRCIQAGPAAESIVNEDAPVDPGAADDVFKVRAVAELAFAPRRKKGRQIAVDPAERDADKMRMEAMVEAAGHNTARLLGRHWLAVEAVAAFLLARQELDGEQVEMIVKSFPPLGGPWEGIKLPEV
jgi:hypothetical protein